MVLRNGRIRSLRQGDHELLQLAVRIRPADPPTVLANDPPHRLFQVDGDRPGVIAIPRDIGTGVAQRAGRGGTTVAVPPTAGVARRAGRRGAAIAVPCAAGVARRARFDPVRGAGESLPPAFTLSDARGSRRGLSSPSPAASRLASLGAPGAGDPPSPSPAPLASLGAPTLTLSEARGSRRHPPRRRNCRRGARRRRARPT